MLQKLNERIQGVVAWIVIILIATTFILFGVDYYMQTHQTNDIEVTVNGEPISKHAFELSYRRNRQQRDPAEITAENEKILRKQVLNDTISNLIAVQGALQSGFNVNPQQAVAAIVNIPQFQQDGHFSSDRYQQALSNAFFTPETFQHEVQQGMLLNQQRFALIGSAFATPGEIERFITLYLQTRSYAYLTVPAKLFMDSKDITDQEIDKYYREHQSQFLTPEQVSIDFVRLSMQNLKHNVQILEEDIERFYEENKINYQVPAKWQVAHILFAVNDDDEQNVKQKADEAYQILQKEPEQFNELVKNQSADKLVASKNGVLPWIEAGQTEFDPVLSTLTLAKPISAPLKTAKGYEVFKLIAVKPAKLKTLEQVKEQIKEQLLAETTQAKYAELLEQLTEASYQNPDSLKPIADQLHLKIERTPLFSKTGGQVDITQTKALLSAAFSHEVLDLNTNSEPIQIDNDNVVVFRIHKHQPAVEKELLQVRPDIVAILTHLNAKNRAKQYGQQIVNADGKLQNDLIAAKNLQWQIVDRAARDSDKADPIITELAFSLLTPNTLQGRPLPNGDFVIAELKEIIKGDFAALDKEHQASLTQQIETNYGLMDYDLYMHNLIKQAKIEQP